MFNFVYKKVLSFFFSLTAATSEDDLRETRDGRGRVAASLGMQLC